MHRHLSLVHFSLVFLIGFIPPSFGAADVARNVSLRTIEIGLSGSNTVSIDKTPPTIGPSAMEKIYESAQAEQYWYQEQLEFERGAKDAASAFVGGARIFGGVPAKIATIPLEIAITRHFEETIDGLQREMEASASRIAAGIYAHSGDSVLDPERFPELSEREKLEIVAQVEEQYVKEGILDEFPESVRGAAAYHLSKGAMQLVGLVDASSRERDEDIRQLAKYAADGLALARSEIGDLRGLLKTTASVGSAMEERLVELASSQTQLAAGLADVQSRIEETDAQIAVMQRQGQETRELVELNEQRIRLVQEHIFGEMGGQAQLDALDNGWFKERPQFAEEKRKQAELIAQKERVRQKLKDVIDIGDTVLTVASTFNLDPNVFETINYAVKGAKAFNAVLEGIEGGPIGMVRAVGKVFGIFGKSGAQKRHERVMKALQGLAEGQQRLAEGQQQLAEMLHEGFNRLSQQVAGLAEMIEIAYERQEAILENQRIIIENQRSIAEQINDVALFMAKRFDRLDTQLAGLADTTDTVLQEVRYNAHLLSTMIGGDVSHCRDVVATLPTPADAEEAGVELYSLIAGHYTHYRDGFERCLRGLTELLRYDGVHPFFHLRPSDELGRDEQHSIAMELEAYNAALNLFDIAFHMIRSQSHPNDPRPSFSRTEFARLFLFPASDLSGIDAKHYLLPSSWRRALYASLRGDFRSWWHESRSHHIEIPYEDEAEKAQLLTREDVIEMQDGKGGLLQMWPPDEIHYGTWHDQISDAFAKLGLEQPADIGEASAFLFPLIVGGHYALPDEHLMPDLARTPLHMRKYSTRYFGGPANLATAIPVRIQPPAREDEFEVLFKRGGERHLLDAYRVALVLSWTAQLYHYFEMTDNPAIGTKLYPVEELPAPRNVNPRGRELLVAALGLGNMAIFQQTILGGDQLLPVIGVIHSRHRDFREPPVNSVPGFPEVDDIPSTTGKGVRGNGDEYFEDGYFEHSLAHYRDSTNSTWSGWNGSCPAADLSWLDLGDYWREATFDRATDDSGRAVVCALAINPYLAINYGAHAARYNPLVRWSFYLTGNGRIENFSFYDDSYPNQEDLRSSEELRESGSGYTQDEYARRVNEHNPWDKSHDQWKRLVSALSNDHDESQDVIGRGIRLTFGKARKGRVTHQFDEDGRFAPGGYYIDMYEPGGWHARVPMPHRQPEGVHLPLVTKPGLAPLISVRHELQLALRGYRFTDLMADDSAVEATILDLLGNPS